ncbi:hypothetical protein AMTRI_Chr08g205230 [Amborella trichopoda]
MRIARSGSFSLKRAFGDVPFSAFCLRSSVVSVLISLISDTWSIGPHDIKLIFQWGRDRNTSLLVGPSSIAHSLHYCMGLAHSYQIGSKFLHLVFDIF